MVRAPPLVYGCTADGIQGDVSKVRIGAGTTVGDRAVINVPDFKRRVKDEHPDTTVGERCVIGMFTRIAVGG